MDSDPEESSSQPDEDYEEPESPPNGSNIQPAYREPTPAPTPEPEPDPTQEPDPEPEPGENPSNYVGNDLGTFISIFGSPNSSDYAPSCLGPGKDGLLYYDGFTVYTYQDENGNEQVMGIG